MATGARQGPEVGGGSRKLQQLAQGRGAGPMHGRAHGGLDRLQIRAAVFTALSKDTTEELVYFSRDLLMDCRSRFFPLRSSRPLRAPPGAAHRFFH